MRLVSAPCWFAAGVYLALPCAWLTDFRRRRELRRRTRLGLSVACGYDLRASGQRCPECGAVPGNR